MHDIEAAILDGCLKQDTRSEYALYKKCFRPLMAICFRYTRSEDNASELMNKGFLKILQNLNKYDRTRPFDKWAKRIMVNTIVDEFRANKKQRELIENIDMNDLNTSFHPVNLNAAESHFSAEDIQRYLAKVPEASRVVLNLYAFDGLSHKEIAERLNISEGTSKWHVSNARSILKRFLANALTSLKSYVL